jgi:hypothetical protein
MLSYHLLPGISSGFSTDTEILIRGEHPDLNMKILFISGFEEVTQALYVTVFAHTCM